MMMMMKLVKQTPEKAEVGSDYLINIMQKWLTRQHVSMENEPTGKEPRDWKSIQWLEKERKLSQRCKTTTKKDTENNQGWKKD